MIILFRLTKFSFLPICVLHWRASLLIRLTPISCDTELLTFRLTMGMKCTVLVALLGSFCIEFGYASPSIVCPMCPEQCSIDGGRPSSCHDLCNSIVGRKDKSYCEAGYCNCGGLSVPKLSDERKFTLN